MLQRESKLASASLSSRPSHPRSQVLGTCFGGFDRSKDAAWHTQGLWNFQGSGRGGGR